MQREKNNKVWLNSDYFLIVKLDWEKLGQSEIQGIQPRQGKDIEPWKRELSPERLFRGWWEELTKAYKRFCLQDESDCARKCNVEHGTCNLWEDKHEVNPAKTWKYRCECDPGYEPQEDTNTKDESQYLCANGITQRDRQQCETLDYEDGKAITPAILDKHLNLPNGGRQKRMVRRL